MSNPVCSISHDSVATQTYQVGASTLSFTFNAYTLSTNCDYSLTYSSKLSSGATLPNFISFTPSSRSFSIYTTDTTKAYTYTIQVFATFNDAEST